MLDSRFSLALDVKPRNRPTAGAGPYLPSLTREGSGVGWPVVTRRLRPSRTHPQPLPYREGRGCQSTLRRRVLLLRQ